MHSGIVWTIIAVSVLAIAGLMSLPWLWKHRKPAVLPPPPVLPVTFTGSRFLAIFYSLFAIPAAAGCWIGLADTLFIENDFTHPWLLVPVLLVVVILSHLAWIFGVGAILPDRMVLSETGIWCRVCGRIRQWPWDQVQDANAGARGPLMLLLWQDDPRRAKWLRKLLWKTNAYTIPLGFLWKPPKFSWSGESAIVIAICAILLARREREAVTVTNPK